MVLATFLKSIGITTFTSLIFLSCSKEAKIKEVKGYQTEVKQSVVTDTTSINGVLFELIDNKGKTELKIHSDKYKISGDIKFNAPCYFLRSGGKVLSFSYPNIGVENTIIIQGHSGLHGLLIKKDSIIYEDYLTTINTYDLNIGPDEKVYYGFAHRYHKNK